jgi:hypothetical protein
MDKVTAKYVFSNGNLTKVMVGEMGGFGNHCSPGFLALHATILTLSVVIVSVSNLAFIESTTNVHTSSQKR